MFALGLAPEVKATGDYLVVALGADPHALGNGFEGGLQAVQVIDTGARVAHEQLTTASAHCAEVLMDVSLSGRTNHQSVFRAAGMLLHFQ